MLSLLIFRETAVVRGAILHKIAPDLVSHRVLGANYGIEKAVPFQTGVHPVSRMSQGPDGILRCTGVMHWFATKVPSLSVQVSQAGRNSAPGPCCATYCLQSYQRITVSIFALVGMHFRLIVFE
jgi:hypothetical protein